MSAAAPAVEAVTIESAEPEYIGRHAAGPHPAPRQTSNVPRIRPRERLQVQIETLLSA